MTVGQVTGTQRDVKFGYDEYSAPVFDHRMHYVNTKKGEKEMTEDEMR